MGGWGAGEGGGVLWVLFAVWVGGLCGGWVYDLWEVFAGVGGGGEGGVGGEDDEGGGGGVVRFVGVQMYEGMGDEDVGITIVFGCCG